MLSNLLGTISKCKKSFLRTKSFSSYKMQGFQLFCKVADILLKAPDVNVFLAP